MGRITSSGMDFLSRFVSRPHEKVSDTPVLCTVITRFSGAEMLKVPTATLERRNYDSFDTALLLVLAKQKVPACDKHLLWRKNTRPVE